MRREKLIRCLWALNSIATQFSDHLIFVMRSWQLPVSPISLAWCSQSSLIWHLTMGPGCPDARCQNGPPLPRGVTISVIIIGCQDVQSPIIITARRSLSSGKQRGMNKQHFEKWRAAVLNSLKSLQHGLGQKAHFIRNPCFVCQSFNPSSYF